MYINNCLYGINAKNQSTINLVTPIIAHNVSNVVVSLVEGSVFTAIGTSGPTGPSGPTGSTGTSFSFYQCDAGIYAKNSIATVSNGAMDRMRFGVVAYDNSKVQYVDSFLRGPQNASLVAYGVYADNSSICTVYGIGVTGYTGGTGNSGPGNGNFRSNNNSIIFFDNSAMTNLTNITSPSTNGINGFSVSDINRGASILSSSKINTGGGGVDIPH